MHYHTMEEMLADAHKSGAKFYMEAAEDGLFLRTVATNKLVVRLANDELMFYDPDEVDIYSINALNEHMEHDSAMINMLLDAAWNEEGFGATVEAEFGNALAAMNEFVRDINDSE